MRKNTFERLMNGHSKYVSEDEVRSMTGPQLNEFKKDHNPWVMWDDEDGDTHYTKLNEYVEEYYK